jgi:micrococcal nuclease
MKKYILILLIITGCYELKSQDVPIIRVIDGDTYEVLLNGKKQPIRLMNVDAPELKQAFGAAVKDSVSHLLKNKTVEISALKLDLYGRLLVQINIQGKALDSLLVAKGWAWCYEKYNTNETLPPLQIMAIAKRKGLWYCHRPVPP